jgi:cell division septal protein FtsQ
MAEPKKKGRVDTHPSVFLTFSQHIALFLRYTICTLAGCSLLLGGFIMTRHIFHFIYRSDFFQINETRIEGASKDLERDIRDWLDNYLDEQGTNLCRMNPDSIRTSLDNLPRTLETTIKKEYPKSLVIRVKERKPIMVANLDQPVLIDREGVLLDRADHEIIDRLGLPMLTGIGARHLKMGEHLVEERLPAILETVEFIRNDDPLLHGRIVEWNISSRNEVTSILRSSTEVRFGNQLPLELLDKLSSSIKQKPEIERSTYIDLRMQNQIVYHIDG